jgi:hypothetical protein
MWLLNGSTDDLNSASRIISLLDRHHGMVTGVFTGDECLAGLSPVQGTELCAVAEFMYSLEEVLSVTGGATWGDRLEQVAYNALPATFSPDMWTHQYDQQVNQVQAVIMEDRPFYTNGPSANIFGLEPNYGCCTANLSQPWPKFASSLIMEAEDGLACVAYAPGRARAKVRGHPVEIRINTGYPFKETLEITVTVNQIDTFTLYLRVPAWAGSASLMADGQVIALPRGAFYPYRRKWEETTVLTLRFPMCFTAVPRPNRLWAFTRGPLAYSLKIGEKWSQLPANKPYKVPPHCDYEVRPATPWQYALQVDPVNPEEGIRLEEDAEIGDCPFSPDGAPVRAYVRGKRIRWGMKNGSACPEPDDRIPLIPPAVSGKDGAETESMLTLIPYGCTNLRMTEMPVI